MAVFFSGVFNPNVFSTEGGAVEEVVKTGTGGIDPAKRNRIYKPTGLPLKPPKEGRKSTQDRVDESGQIQAEIASRLSKEFTEELNQEREAASIALMTQAQIDAEIAFLMKEKMQKMQKEDEEIIQLIVAIAAKDL